MKKKIAALFAATTMCTALCGTMPVSAASVKPTVSTTASQEGDWYNDTAVYMSTIDKTTVNQIKSAGFAYRITSIESVRAGKTTGSVKVCIDTFNRKTYDLGKLLLAPAYQNDYVVGLQLMYVQNGEYKLPDTTNKDCGFFALTDNAPKCKTVPKFTVSPYSANSNYVFVLVPAIKNIKTGEYIYQDDICDWNKANGFANTYFYMSDEYCVTQQAFKKM